MVVDSRSSFFAIRKPILRRPDGKIMPGSGGLPGAGRPKGRGCGLPPLSVLVREMAESQGVTVAEAMGAVATAAFKSALAGDTTAMKMLLSKLPDDAPEAAPGSPISVENVGPPVPTDAEFYSRMGQQMLDDLHADIDALQGAGTAEAMNLDPVKDREAILAHFRRPDRQAQAEQILAELDKLNEADEVARLLS